MPQISEVSKGVSIAFLFFQGESFFLTRFRNVFVGTISRKHQKTTTAVKCFLWDVKQKTWFSENTEFRQY